MKVELTIKCGWAETKVVLDGYIPMVEKLREAIKQVAKEYDSLAEIC